MLPQMAAVGLFGIAASPLSRSSHNMEIEVTRSLEFLSLSDISTAEFMSIFQLRDIDRQSLLN